MGAQDNTERVLRSLYVMISKSEIYEFDEDKIVIDRDRITSLLSELKECIHDMMDEYEMTKESRDQAEREFRKQADEIVLDASHKAEDVYAASVMYTDEALGNVQRIMAEAEESVKAVYEEMQKRLVEERHTVQSNQTDLQSQLQDLTDTDKYVKLINERNREIRKEKEKEQRLALRQRDAAIYADRQTQVRVDQQALRRLGLVPEEEENGDEAAADQSAALPEATAAENDETIYADRQTQVRVDQEVLRKLGLAQQTEDVSTEQPADTGQKTRKSGQQSADIEQKIRKSGQQSADTGQSLQMRGQQSEDSKTLSQEWDEELLRQQMLDRAKELERRKARISQRQRAARLREEPGEISLMDLNPFAEDENQEQEMEDELIRLDLDEDYFKWKEEQDAAFDANVAKAKSKRRTRRD